MDSGRDSRPQADVVPLRSRQAPRRVGYIDLGGTPVSFFPINLLIYSNYDITLTYRLRIEP